MVFEDRAAVYQDIRPEDPRATSRTKRGAARPRGQGQHFAGRFRRGDRRN